MWRRDRIVSTPESQCPMCKRVRKLSGEKRCAIHVKAEFLGAHHIEFDSTRIADASPPGSFVGRFGYRTVFLGPMRRLVPGDTRILDTTQSGLGRSFEEI